MGGYFWPNCDFCLLRMMAVCLAPVWMGSNVTVDSPVVVWETAWLGIPACGLKVTYERRS
jgi:hypothetical protein